MNEMYELLKKAPARFRKSFGYCRDGLRAVLAKEESFRLECLGLAVLAAVLCISPWPWWKVVAMLAGYLLIPLAELFNSAIEDVCDLVTGEYAERVKNAKDKGALAVLTAIFVNALILVALLLCE